MNRTHNIYERSLSTTLRSNGNPCFIRVLQNYFKKLGQKFLGQVKTEKPDIALTQYREGFKGLGQQLGQGLGQELGQMIFDDLQNTHSALAVVAIAELGQPGQIDSKKLVVRSRRLTSNIKGFVKKRGWVTQHCIYTYTGTLLWRVSRIMYISVYCCLGEIQKPISKFYSRFYPIHKNNGGSYHA